ncbi:unnamed protein product [Cercopithifilaria johnstoni]|uniref:Uncharacterized protein n=1 Tax=Cercopithifilaria johnstoni TaxID=2874296 RepID=A0A8J2MR92_9BILA|nr:unnamed protein product [Cercopithifilaria johnstoni]
MTLMTITSFVCLLLNISYIIALLIVCVRKRNVETIKEKNEQYKPSEKPKSSKENRKEPLGPSPLSNAAVTKEAAVVVAAGVPAKQVLQRNSTAANQMQQKINDGSEDSSRGHKVLQLPFVVFFRAAVYP